MADIGQLCELCSASREEREKEEVGGGGRSSGHWDQEMEMAGAKPASGRQAAFNPSTGSAGHVTYGSALIRFSCYSNIR